MPNLDSHNAPQSQRRNKFDFSNHLNWT